jgi:hypothetical protein
MVALMVEIEQLCELIGSQKDSVGANEFERIPLERIVTGCRANAARRFRLSDVNLQRWHGDDAETDGSATDAEEARDGRLGDHFS